MGTGLVLPLCWDWRGSQFLLVGGRVGTSPHVPFLAGHGWSWVRLIDVISAEGQQCQPETQGLWEGTGISGLASHNTAFLPDLQHPPS